MAGLTKERVYEINDAFARGQPDVPPEAFDARIDFIRHAPTEVFPHPGRRRGRAKALEAMSALHEELEVLSFLPISTLIDGNSAALTVLGRSGIVRAGVSPIFSPSISCVFARAA